MSKHISEKYLKKLDEEGILIRDKDVRFSVTFLDKDGKLVGRDWHKGELVLSKKRIVLLSKEVKFLNIKRKDERFGQFKLGEDNPVCLAISLTSQSDDALGGPSVSTLQFQIFTPQVSKILKQLEARKKTPGAAS